MVRGCRAETEPIQRERLRAERRKRGASGAERVEVGEGRKDRGVGIAAVPGDTEGPEEDRGPHYQPGGCTRPPASAQASDTG